MTYDLSPVFHYIRTYDLIAYDSCHLFGPWYKPRLTMGGKKRTDKKPMLVIFAITAAAVLLSPLVAGCPSHFTFKSVE